MTLAQVSTPNIIRQAQLAVLTAPSIIQDARLSAAPYSTTSTRSVPGTPASHPSNPSTRPPSRGNPLPITAVKFGLPPPTATPVPYTPQPLAAPMPIPASTALISPREPPFVECVTITPPAITPTIPGLVPAEWANFKKSVIEYNLTLDLYKPDLDWKKANLREPSDLAALNEYYSHIGKVNQRIGAIALMEKVMGNYISMVGTDLVQQQAKEDNLDLPPNDVEWFLTQGKRNNSQLLEDERVPQEDFAPALFLPPLLATPAPEVTRSLADATPVSSLMPLTTSPSDKAISPHISELAMPVMCSFAPSSDAQPTPKVVAMDISPTEASPVPMLLAPTPSMSMTVVLRPISSDVNMTDAQCVRVDEVLHKYHKQEEQALKTLHATRQHNRAAEVALQLEKAKLRDVEIHVEEICVQKEALLNPLTSPTGPNSVSSSYMYVPPSQRSGSEAMIAAQMSDSYAPLSLSTIPSALLPLPSHPHAPSLSVSMHAPLPGPSTTKDKGKQKAQTPDAAQEFMFTTGRQGFHDMRQSLLNIQAPLCNSLSIASMENRSDTTISTEHLHHIDTWLNMMLNLINKAEKSVDFCQAATQLPPYPVIGLAWTALANNSMTIDIASSKAIHSLVNSIMLVNVNKNATAE